MMILNLNLLSPVKKTRNEHVIRFLFIKNMLEVSLFVAAIVATALLLSWLVLQDDFNNLSGSSILINQGFSGYNQEIRKINQTNRNIVLAGQDFQPITAKLLELTNTMPVGIKLSSLNLERTELKLVLSGAAKTRDNLLDYQEKIKKISWVEKIDTQASQLFQKENINFEFTITIKKEKNDYAS